MFKQLLRTFFVDFLDLFLPQVLQYLDRSSIEFVDKELITDVNARERHEVDLLVKAKFSGQESFFLIHVETQASAQEQFPRRMFHYFARLYEQYDLPVYPIALFSYESPARPEQDLHVVEFPDLRVLDFHFRVIQLNRLNWRDFVRRENPVAAALMTRMRIAPEDRPQVMRECLRLIVTLKLDPARQTLIRGFMSAYLKLSAEEWKAYNRTVQDLEPAEREAMMEVIDQFEERGMIKGEARGLLMGEARGAARVILRVLSRRFGQVSPELEAKVRDLPTEKLDSLAEAVLDLRGLDELENWLRLPGNVSH